MNNNLKVWASGNAGRPLEIEAKAVDNIAQISIVGRIASWSEANSGTVRKDIIALGKKYKTAKVYINSEGGSCIEANEIVNILEDNFDNITVVGGALIASAASFIFCSFPNQLSKNSQVMIHEPRGYYGGTHKSITKQIKLLKSLEDDYVAVYAAKTGKTSEDISKLWADGDHWMSAQEALKEGFADVISGNARITTEDAVMITAMGSPYQVIATATPPTPQPQNSNKSDMNQEVIAVSLGLSKDATEAEINAKITALKAAETENATLKSAAEQAEKTQKATAIKAMLDTAEQEKKITPEVRAHYETMAESNLESVKAILDNTAAVTPISAQINGEAQGAPGAAAAGNFKYKSYEACVEANDTDAWEAFAAAHPDEATAMFEAYLEPDTK